MSWLKNYSRILVSNLLKKGPSLSVVFIWSLIDRFNFSIEFRLEHFGLVFINMQLFGSISISMQLFVSAFKKKYMDSMKNLDVGMVKEKSANSLEIPLGPITRARAKRFKETLNALIRDAKVEETHVFNSKEETKMVHIIKVNPDLDQEPRRF